MISNKTKLLVEEEVVATVEIVMIIAEAVAETVVVTLVAAEIVEIVAEAEATVLIVEIVVAEVIALIVVVAEIAVTVAVIVLNAVTVAIAVAVVVDVVTVNSSIKLQRPNRMSQNLEKSPRSLSLQCPLLQSSWTSLATLTRRILSAHP